MIFPRIGLAPFVVPTKHSSIENKALNFDIDLKKRICCPVRAADSLLLSWLFYIAFSSIIEA
jgi:hypothetical protein